MSVRCFLPAHHQDLVISIDFGINFSLFVPRRRGTVADLFDLPISVGTILANRLQSAADKAAAINLTRLLQPSGTAGRIFQEVNQCCGVVASQLTATYWRRLNTGMRTLGECITGGSQQGLSLITPLLTLRKDSELGKAAWPKTPWRYFSHQHQGKELASFERLQLILEGKSSSRRCTKLSYKAEVITLSTQMVLARRAELQAVQLATDVKSLIQWLKPRYFKPWLVLQSGKKLFDFIVEELLDAYLHIAFVLCG